MRMAVKVLALMIIISSYSYSQLKGKQEEMRSVTGSLIRSEGSGLLFGWFDPSKLSIRNSYSLSYTSFGNKGFSLGTLTSSFSYKISDPLSLVLDLSLIHSPYSSLGNDFSRSISGLYLTRAQLNYRPSEDLLFQIQFRQLPTLYWLNNYELDYFPTIHRVQEEESD